MISFIEIFNKGGYKSWGIREVSINPSLIIKMQEDDEIESYVIGKETSEKYKVGS